VSLRMYSTFADVQRCRNAEGKPSRPRGKHGRNLFFSLSVFFLAPFTGSRLPVEKKGCKKIRLWLEAELEELV
jgi:hypothetical protein